MNRRLLAGIDVGGSKIAVLVVAADLAAADLAAADLVAADLAAPHLTVVGRRTIPTGVAGGSEDTALGRIADALDATLADAHANPADLGAIGVGVPGRVDAETGVVSHSVNLGWRDLALGPALATRYGVPVRVENDVRAAAAGLHERRVLGDDDLAYLSIGTGISAGVVLGGQLHRGRRGMAGEIGHVVLDPDGPVCPCGLRGCFEAIAAGPSIARRAEAGLRDGNETGGSILETIRATRPLTAVDVYEAAAALDPFGAALVESTGRYVARAVHELVMTYDVRRVALGGGVATAGATFLDPILRGLDRLRDASPLAREVLPADVVHLLAEPAEAGPWGAVILARSGLAHGARPATAAAASGGGE